MSLAIFIFTVDVRIMYMIVAVMISLYYKKLCGNNFVHGPIPISNTLDFNYPKKGDTKIPNESISILVRSLIFV